MWNNSASECIKTTKPLLHVLLNYVLTLYQIFPTMFKPREIHKFTRGTDAYFLVAPLLLQEERTVGNED